MTTRTPHNFHQAAFTLVELSVVLVLIGLMLGGALFGKGLMKSGELRNVMSEYTSFVQAIRSFDQKYNAIPGDMSNATSYWGKDSTNCNGHTGAAASPGTCNGNGNAVIAAAAGANATGEMFQFWKQLTLAGMVEGSYSGLAGSGSAGQCTLAAQNCPQSKRKGSMWSAYTDSNLSGDTNTYATEYGSFLMYGGETSVSGTTLNAVATLTPREAYTLDTKLDDGKPATGLVIARFWNDACAEAEDGSSANTDLRARYRTSVDTNQCSLYFTRIIQ